MGVSLQGVNTSRRLFLRLYAIAPTKHRDGLQLGRVSRQTPAPSRSSFRGGIVCRWLFTTARWVFILQEKNLHVFFASEDPPSDFLPEKDVSRTAKGRFRSRVRLIRPWATQPERRLHNFQHTVVRAAKYEPWYSRWSHLRASSSPAACAPLT